MAMVTMGVDPGASGGIVVLDDSGKVEQYNMPTDVRDLCRLLSSIIGSNPHLRLCYLEQVQGYIGNAHPGATMFEFGKSYGRLEAALYILKGHDYHYIAPQVWQRALGIKSRGAKETKPQFKRRLKEYALKLYPHSKVTLKTADALLLAHLAMGIKKGTIQPPKPKRLEGGKLLPYV